VTRRGNQRKSPLTPKGKNDQVTECGKGKRERRCPCSRIKSSRRGLFLRRMGKEKKYPRSHLEGGGDEGKGGGGGDKGPSSASPQQMSKRKAVENSIQREKGKKVTRPCLQGGGKGKGLPLDKGGTTLKKLAEKAELLSAEKRRTPGIRKEVKGGRERSSCCRGPSGSRLVQKRGEPLREKKGRGNLKTIDPQGKKREKIRLRGGSIFFSRRGKEKTVEPSWTGEKNLRKSIAIGL